jgi:hypothetical protein
MQDAMEYCQQRGIETGKMTDHPIDGDRSFYAYSIIQITLVDSADQQIPL